MHPRDELAMTLDRIYNYKMTTTSGGNLSIKDDHGDIWITPARVDKGQLSPKDIVCVKPDGTLVGPHPPSSEFPFHKAIYEARPDIASIVHAHPMALVAFSCAQKTPDTKVFPTAWNTNGLVGFAEYGVPGSEDLGTKIAVSDIIHQHAQMTIQSTKRPKKIHYGVRTSDPCCSGAVPAPAQSAST